MSTSRSSSIVNDREPVDLGRRDAGVVERHRDRLARERQLGVGRGPCRTAVWPMPTIAVRSCREHTHVLPALELGRAALDEARRRPRPGPRCGSRARRPSPPRRRRVARSTSSDRLSSRLASPMAVVGPAASRSAHSLAVASSSSAGTTLFTRPMRSASAADEVVAEEHQLLRLLEADEAGEHVGAAAVGDEAAAHEHLDDAGVVGGDDQVAGDRDVGAAAGRGAVHRGDHRLLAVEDRAR